MAENSNGEPVKLSVVQTIEKAQRLLQEMDQLVAAYTQLRASLEEDGLPPTFSWPVRDKHNQLVEMQFDMCHLDTEARISILTPIANAQAAHLGIKSDELHKLATDLRLIFNSTEQAADAAPADVVA